MNTRPQLALDKALISRVCISSISEERAVEGLNAKKSPSAHCIAYRVHSHYGADVNRRMVQENAAQIEQTADMSKQLCLLQLQLTQAQRHAPVTLIIGNQDRK